MSSFSGSYQYLPARQLFLQAAALGGDIAGDYYLAVFHLVRDAALLDHGCDVVGAELAGRPPCVSMVEQSVTRVSDAAAPQRGR